MHQTGTAERCEENYDCRKEEDVDPGKQSSQKPVPAEFHLKRSRFSVCFRDFCMISPVDGDLGEEACRELDEEDHNICLDKTDGIQNIHHRGGPENIHYDVQDYYRRKAHESVGERNF